MMDEAGLIRGGSGRGPAQQYHDEDDDAYSSDGSMKQSIKSNDSEEAKRQKRLALNRKAAHESRRRKKVKFQQLTETLEMIRKENAQLDLQNDGMRKKLETPQANQYTAEREALQEENTNLRMALLTALQGLSDHTQEGEGVEKKQTEEGVVTSQQQQEEGEEEKKDGEEEKTQAKESSSTSNNPDRSTT